MDPKQPLSLQVSESLVRSGADTNPPTPEAAPLQASGTPPEIQTLLYSEFPRHVEQLNAFAAKVVDFVGFALKERVARRWTQSDDDLFLPHTLLVKTVLDMDSNVQAGIGLFPAQLWIGKLWPLTKLAEHQLRQAEPKARIHKGAPLFNVGLCFFLAGDFDRAFQYFTEAGTENELSGRGSRYLVPTGDNRLAEKAIIHPLAEKLIPLWQADFQRICFTPLDHAELKALSAWLVQRAPDAFQTITALHRLRLLTKGLDNEASRYQMVRALADIVLAVESTLRRWQGDIGGQLCDRMVALLNVNPVSLASFDGFHSDFKTKWAKPKRETGGAVNWVVTETCSRLAARPTVAERIGVAAYLVVRLRNSLMHVNEETLDIHKNPQLCVKAAGIAFATLRVSKHGNENTLSAL